MSGSLRWRLRHGFLLDVAAAAQTAVKETLAGTNFVSEMMNLEFATLPS